MRFGPRYNAKCHDICTANGDCLSWVNSCRYLGVYLCASSYFKCSFSYANKSFYRSFNSIFGKIGRIASEEVILHLVNMKCVPALLYGLDACPINISDKRSFDFVFTRVLMKLFKTSSIIIIDECYEMFNLKHMSQLISERKCRFLGNFHKGNELCNLIVSYTSDVQLSHNLINTSSFVHSCHVCMPACIRIVFILCFCSLSLLQAAHVANKVVYIYI